jgi:hypothetical protein
MLSWGPRGGNDAGRGIIMQFGVYAFVETRPDPLTELFGSAVASAVSAELIQRNEAKTSALVQAV